MGKNPGSGSKFNVYCFWIHNTGFHQRIGMDKLLILPYVSGPEDKLEAEGEAERSGQDGGKEGGEGGHEEQGGDQEGAPTAASPTTPHL